MGSGFCGDIRASRRFEKVLEDIADSGSLVVRKLGRDRAGEIAAHRLLGSERTTPQAILEESAARTAQACRGRRVVVAQDTTEINFRGRDRGRRGLGPAGDGISLGFFIHPLIAIDAAEETVLGVVGGKIWTRAHAQTKTHRHKRLPEDKESIRWIEAAQIAADRLTEAAGVVVIGDRENDIYQAFACKPPHVHLITRARGNRRLVTGRLLFETAERFASAFEIEVRIAASERSQQGQVARLAVSFGKATIARPRTGQTRQGPEACEIHVVVAREIDPPAGTQPLIWRLLTTLPIETAEDAREIVRLYRLRWRIEEVFRVLKRDGLALEKTQVESAWRLFNLAALAVVAATRILQLTDARDASPRPATDVIDEGAIEAAAAIGTTLEGRTERQKNPHPRGSLSWLAWITARLGGWNAYYKPPGPKTMADGWRRLAAMLDGYAIAHRKSLV
jgi:Transposase DDE domain